MNPLLAKVGLGVVLLLAGFVSALVTRLGGSYEAAGSIGALVGFLVSFPASLWAVHAGLRKRYRGFRVSVVPVADR